MISFGIHLILCLGLAYLYSRLWKDLELNSLYWIALLFKLLTGIALGGYYWYMVKSGDTYNYHIEAIKFTQLFKISPSDYFASLFGGGPTEFQQTLLYENIPRALLFTKILSVFYLFTFDNYWAAGLYFSLFSFAGLWMMSVRMIRLSPDFKWSAILAFLFYPSMVFWSSGIMKETLLMGSVGIVFFLVMGPWERMKILKGMMLLVLLVFIWTLKYYIAILLFPALLMILLGKQWKENRISLGQYRLSWILLPVLLVILSFLHPNLHLDRVYQIAVDNHNELLELTEGENYIHIGTDTGGEVLKSIPKLYFLGWFGPIFNFEAPDLMIAGFEGLILLILTIVFLLSFKKAIYQKHHWILLPLLMYIMAATFFVTLSTPAYGTLVRYRVAYMCFLVFIILLHQPWIKYLRQKISFNR